MICFRCKIDKDRSAFREKGGNTYCRDCFREYHTEYQRKRRLDPEYQKRINAGQLIRRQNNINSRLKAILSTIKKGAEKRGLPFNLIFMNLQVLMLAQNYTCKQTGILFDFTMGKGKRPFGPTVDRIDSSRGYEPDNIQLVCNIYNYAKNEFSDSDVLLFANALSNRSKPQ